MVKNPRTVFLFNIIDICRRYKNGGTDYDYYVLCDEFRIFKTSVSNNNYNYATNLHVLFLFVFSGGVSILDQADACDQMMKLTDGHWLFILQPKYNKYEPYFGELTLPTQSYFEIVPYPTATLYACMVVVATVE